MRSGLHAACRASLSRARIDQEREPREHFASGVRDVPELPDLIVYMDALPGSGRPAGRAHRRPQPVRPALGRTAARVAVRPRRSPPSSASGSAWSSAFEPDLFLVIHLMIAGRLRWVAPSSRASREDAAAEAGARGVRVRARHARLHRSQLEEARLDADGARAARRCARSTRAASSRSPRRARSFATRARAREPHRSSAR